MIFTLTIDLPVLCLCTLLESETLWTGELRSSLTGSVWETIGPQCSASQTCALPQHSRAGGEPLHVPSLLLKEIQAALSLRASFLNLPYPSSSHYRNTWVEHSLCTKLLCLHVNWPSATEIVWGLAALWMLGRRGWGTVGFGCKKAVPCKANTRDRKSVV